MESTVCTVFDGYSAHREWGKGETGVVSRSLQLFFCPGVLPSVRMNSGYQFNLGHPLLRNIHPLYHTVCLGCHYIKFPNALFFCMRKCITCLKCHTYFNVWQRLVGAMWIPPFGKKNSKCANCVHMSLCPAGLQLHMSKSSIMTCLWAQNRIWTGGHEGQSPFTDSHLQQEWYWWRRPQEVRIREVIIITEAFLCSVLYRIVFCLFFSFFTNWLIQQDSNWTKMNPKGDKSFWHLSNSRTVTIWTAWWYYFVNCWSKNDLQSGFLRQHRQNPLKCREKSI